MSHLLSGIDNLLCIRSLLDIIFNLDYVLQIRKLENDDSYIHNLVKVFVYNIFWINSSCYFSKHETLHN